MIKKWSTFFTILALLFASLVLSNRSISAVTLTDIPSQYKNEIAYLIEKRIITGYDDGLFRPNQYVTREEAAKIIGVALKLDKTQRTTPFPDVKKSSYASGYIYWATKQGIITGYPDGTFKPKNKITRGEMAFLLKRAFTLKGADKSVFRDVHKTNKRLYEAVDALASNGLSNGYPEDQTFRPNRFITRNDFSLLVARGLNEQFRVAITVEERFVQASTGLNVRSGPGISYKRIGSLKNGTTVQVISKHGDWAYMKAGSLLGYVHSNYLTVKAPQLPKPPSQPKRHLIAIDAGHGGSDPGSSGNKLIEKDITMQVAKRVEQTLKKKGIDVFMTRTTDTYVGLEKRVNLAVQAGADAFLSIHTNSFTQESANGTETYYSLARTSTRANDSKELATFVQKRLVKALGTRDRGVKTAKFAVIHQNPLPSALVELAFISNKADAQKLASATYQQKAAEAISNGIIDYYNWKDKQK